MATPYYQNISDCSYTVYGVARHTGRRLQSASPFEASNHLCVAQELAKVDVEHVPCGTQHDVVVVAITDAQQVGGHAAARTGIDEVLRGLESEAKGHGGMEKERDLFKAIIWYYHYYSDNLPDKLKLCKHSF